MPLLLLLVGGLIGAMLSHRFETIVAGACIGFIAGYVIDSRRKAQAPTPIVADPLVLLDPRVAERLRAMERRIAMLEASLPRGHSAEAPPRPPEAAPRPAEEPARPAEAPSRPAEAPSRPASATRVAHAAPAAAANASTHADERLAEDELRRDASVPPVPAYAARRTAPAAPSESSVIWRWIAGGNTLARTGVVVLFIGVAFLLKYASEHVTVPIEVRLAAVALGAVALLAFGWRLRMRRAGYAMSLQGAGAGILYLTVFAALRLYQLLSPVAAFGLLFWIGALSSFLAIRQDAMALAVLGVLGGFAAPILASTAAGSHVMLFSYYAVLNGAILAIAWFKAWRLLNVVGFACTFLVGAFWGVTAYRPEDFATTEPFLILFFVFYVAIATLYALRRSVELRRYVDATLVFGTPLVAAGLQAALVHDIQYAMAWSAIGASALYLLLARLLHGRRPELRLLVEAFLALGVVFATLAVPLALDARLTSATWALEGAALVWVGVRQAHRRARTFGLLLQLAAGIAFALGFSLWTERLAAGSLPVLNSDCLGALLVACAGLVSAAVLSRTTAIKAGERAFVPVVFGWGIAWWLGAGWHEIDRFVAADTRIAVFVVFLAGSAVLFAALAARLAWSMARVPAYALPAALLVIGVARVMNPVAGAHLFAAGGYIAWPLALAAQVLLLRHFDFAARPAHIGAVDAGHAILVWLVALIAADELAWLAQSNISGSVWRLVPWGLVPALMLMAIATLTARTSWPVGAHAHTYLRGGAIPLAAAALAWTLYANIASSGDPAPLPFLPLANPLDLVQAIVIVAVALWFARMQQGEGRPVLEVATDARGAAAVLVLLFWVTCSTLRTLHHFADVPWALAPLWASRSVQSALSIVWSLFALAAMVVAHRRGWRVAWVVGAALLGIVVAKLFAVDLSQVGGIQRIVSFIGVGALLLVVGYMAPVPPRQQAR